MPRLTALLAVLAFAVLALPGSASAATCSVKSLKPNALGPSYTTRLVVTGTSCASGKTFVKAYYTCRRAHGLKGRCTKPVLGYTCREVRKNVIDTSFDATVTCKRGAKKIVHDYTQLT